VDRRLAQRRIEAPRVERFVEAGPIVAKSKSLGAGATKAFEYPFPPRARFATSMSGTATFCSRRFSTVAPPSMSRRGALPGMTPMSARTPPKSGARFRNRRMINTSFAAVGGLSSLNRRAGTMRLRARAVHNVTAGRIDSSVGYDQAPDASESIDDDRAMRRFELAIQGRRYGSRLARVVLDFSSGLHGLVLPPCLAAPSTLRPRQVCSFPPGRGRSSEFERN